ncbi:hypothetical protein O0I10_012596 [Lichtheimia ornata]|uniref:Brl1/Brr6 domain-containing protein n=1 Tax=Lichtheimia ornata TaxID=688661 RepID=A0AAD7XVN1_9FUNG|nr:uncharacterized protein O0I10_012596 [Lichtheimia ornata]KAJ8651832.1 hypothetical protein O0I10_012596 [Lichtheimia ornata]
MSASLLGKKRSLESEEKSIAASDHPFTFVPPLSPGQKLFDQRYLSASFSRDQRTSTTPPHRVRRRRSNSSLRQSGPVTGTTATTQPPAWSNQQSRAQSRIPANWAMYIPIVYNALVALPILYIVFLVVWTFSNDFQIKSEEHQAGVLQQVASCAKNYEINQCHPSSRVPALEDKCNHWEACLNRNPSMISRTKIFAEIVAETLNSFVEPISYKAMLFFGIVIVGLLVISNFNLATYYRKRSSIHYYHQQLQTSTTPSTSISTTTPPS